jgi:replicative DNA helicase
MTKEEAKKHIITNPDIYFKPARKTGYVCPLCHNGTGKNGTGIEENKKNKWHYKCFVCGESGDALHFIGKEYGLVNFQEILEKAYDIYGITIDDGKYKKKEYKKETQKPTEEQRADSRDFYKEANANLNKEYELNKTNYLQKRGISIETQNRFNIGYVKDWINPTAIKEGYAPPPSPRIIIPTSNGSYAARDSRADVEQYKMVKKGNSHLFNSEVLSSESGEPVFIVEGEIDALSVIEAGGQAIGLGGVGNVGKLIAELGTAKDRLYVICLDNDKSGKDASAKLQEELKAKGFAFIDRSEEMLSKGLAGSECYKDPNEALVGNKDGFKAAIENIKAQAPKIFEEKKADAAKDPNDSLITRQALEAIRISNVADDSLHRAFPLAIKRGLTSSTRRLAGGLRGGRLYGLWAITSLGKTTFALQIADNIAKSKQDVLFFSGEMTINEMTAKV